MTRPRALYPALLCLLLPASLLYAADFSSYRGIQFGKSLATAAKQARMEPSEAKVIYKRPALIQELEWRLGSPYRSDATELDPIRDGLLRFYNGVLFQIVTTYDSRKVEGMTEADIVDAISRTYGSVTRPVIDIPYRSNYGDVASVIARWEDPDHEYSLVRTGDQTSYAFILTLKRLDSLAQIAIAEARRLDVLEAPQKAVDLQKLQDENTRLALEKARSVNKPNFRP